MQGWKNLPLKVSFEVIWSPYLGENLTIQREEGNIHDRYTVSVVKGDVVVGQASPRIDACVFFHFLSHRGTIDCEITGKRKHGNGLGVPCRYHFKAKRKLIKQIARRLSLANL